MIEIPAAVSIVDILAQEADFLSIGTNDLVQYLLAVDRTNERVADYYNAFHPAVLRAINKVAEAGIKYDTEVSICGDMASNERMIPFLLGVNISKLSVDPRRIQKVQTLIENTHLGESAHFSKKLLAFGSIEEVTEYIREKNNASIMSYQEQISLSTTGNGDLHDVTDQVQRIVTKSEIQTGIVHVFNMGSTASIIHLEWEPGLKKDIPELLQPTDSSFSRIWSRTNLA